MKLEFSNSAQLIIYLMDSFTKRKIDLPWRLMGCIMRSKSQHEPILLYFNSFCLTQFKRSTLYKHSDLRNFVMLDVNNMLFVK